ncbi:sulfurtransferase TusA family protein [Pengzhenrongella sicca]|uniref:Sulfurtransferase TusA family protein n=1 Tax=Pengzhenrongella sicca TaxID=2819238 RepID=A0A8A4ZJI5_9MICO|nr:sulfurtransferase TusA family protein [Pengzhenrongella sicca]
MIVDARGLRCPLPVIELARAARDAAPGSLLTVLATDPAARYDVPAWARLRGHELVAITANAIDMDGADASDTDMDGAELAITVRTAGDAERPGAGRP